jgi:alpha-amylase
MAMPGPTPDKNTMMQAFEWYVPADHKHQARLEGQLYQLKESGIDNLWVPLAHKAASQQGNGYDTYDIYGAGEFD